MPPRSQLLSLNAYLSKRRGTWEDMCVRMAWCFHGVRVGFPVPQGLKWVQGGTCPSVLDGPMYGYVEAISDGAVG